MSTFLAPPGAGTPRPARQAEAGVLAELLAEAFFNDPLTRWITPDDHRRAQLLPGMFQVFLDMSFAHDGVLTNSGQDAVLTFFPPGAWERLEEHGEAYDRRFAEVLGADAERLDTISRLQAAHHPVDQPHYYLAFGAVRGTAQGAGRISALVAEVVARADAQEVGVYGEASSPGGEAAARRFGCRPAGPEIVLPGDGPSLRPLWRDPR
ncbi:hypothetical protein ACIHFE_31795 [Streptomyces sp. NPDC052396]|uniref:hypothetical protein n=1 Tax=Streptomyces sp. NPDC052396 TaxID=3365689 RepID=UPI0037D4DC42